MLPTTEMADAPVVPILFLGDSGVGKSMLLSPLTDSASRLAVGHEFNKTPPPLRDLDQPYSFDVRLYNRPYRFELYDTASPTNYTLLKPSVLVLCFNIGDPTSLESIKCKWKHIVETHFNHDESLPVIVLGLQRDIRSKEDYDGRVRQLAGRTAHDIEKEPLNGRSFVYPQEGLRIAQELRVDRYCECSALTGELCGEVIEDISRTAAKTTTEKGGRSEGFSCVLM